jgi:S1-C subfamily serine protease
MSLIPQSAFNAVVSINIESNNNGNLEYVCIGTGFLYGYLYKVNGEDKLYSTGIVTNEHVLSTFINDNNIIRKMFIGINHEESAQVKYLEIPLYNNNIPNFETNKDIDLAVISIPYSWIINNGFECYIFRSEFHAATISKLQEIQLSEGHSVFILGFPLGLSGVDKKYVIVKSGIIAKIKDCYDNKNKYFLIDSNIFPGNSGGPVINKIEKIALKDSKTIDQIYLIGVVHNYLPFRDNCVSTQTGKLRIVFEENTGLSEVIPVDYIDQLFQKIIKKEGR